MTLRHHLREVFDAILDRALHDILERAFNAGWDARDQLCVPAQQLNNITDPIFRELADPVGRKQEQFEGWFGSDET